MASLPKENENSMENDVARLFQAGSEGSFSDLKIITDMTPIPVHKFLMATRSPVFKEMLIADPNLHEIVISDFSLEVVRAFIHFLYTDKLEKEVLDTYAEKLFLMADTYQVHGLHHLTADKLAESITDENAVHLLNLADKHNSLVLKKAALKHSLTQTNKQMGACCTW